MVDLKKPIILLINLDNWNYIILVENISNKKYKLINSNLIKYSDFRKVGIKKEYR